MRGPEADHRGGCEDPWFRPSGRDRLHRRSPRCELGRSFSAGHQRRGRWV